CARAFYDVRDAMDYW
nr:immunoglobulin heavy chain junction region [Mus musculus]